MLFSLVVLGACGSQQPTLTAAQLMDPDACRSCHLGHYTEWSGSMHAYAADDPVFRAMNARGQRLTQGALGSFCVNCHAPMAVETGATVDGLNLDQVPKHLRGVTCYFCHSVEAVIGTHDNALRLASDGVMRGGIVDPVPGSAHRSAYSKIHDRQRPESSALCGACHDIVNGLGTAIERTFQEWQGTVYNSATPIQLQTCGKCHMSGSPGNAAQVPGAPVRTVHDHSMPGLDVAFTPFPEKESQRALILAFLATAISARLCVVPDTATGKLVAEVTLDNISVGHGWPSGAAQDRRAWVELRVFQGGSVIYQSGVVGEGQAAVDLADPDLWLLRDVMRDADGAETHDFWEAKSYQSTQLAPAVTNDPLDPRFYHAVTRQFPLPAGAQPERITVRLRVRPLGLDVVDDLVGAGDLGSEIRALVPTFDVGGTVLEWKAETNQTCVPQ